VNEISEERFSFELVTPERTFFLKATSEQEAKEWVTAIVDQIRQLSGVSQPHVHSLRD
jgi:hypothetical protein